MTEPVRSSRFPYLSLQLRIGAQAPVVEALVDTGFDGHVTVPPVLLETGIPPDGHFRWALADGSTIFAPFYLGIAEIGTLPPFPVTITALGNEPLMGRGVTDRFKVTFDHGEHLVVEP
jgi:predicted aspartyl protease